MANRRMISGDLFEDDFVGALSFFDRLLWIGIIVAVADDQGRLMNKPALIRSRVFLYDDDVKDSTVQASVDRLAVAHKIDCYIAGDKELIQIVNWWKYQTPAWASPSKYPAPAGWMDRVKCHTAGNKIMIQNWDKIGGYVDGYVPMQDSALNDGDVKGEDDVKSEDEERLPSFEVFQRTCERAGVLVSTPGDEKTLTAIIKGGALLEDLIAGIVWKTDNSNGRALHAAQLLGPTQTAMSKRLQANGNGSTPKRQRIVERNGVQVLEDIPAGEQ